MYARLSLPLVLRTKVVSTDLAFAQDSCAALTQRAAPYRARPRHTWRRRALIRAQRSPHRGKQACSDLLHIVLRHRRSVESALASTAWMKWYSGSAHPLWHPLAGNELSSWIRQGAMPFCRNRWMHAKCFLQHCEQILQLLRYVDVDLIVSREGISDFGNETVIHLVVSA